MEGSHLPQAGGGVQVYGHVTPGWERVADAFAANFGPDGKGEVGASVCILDTTAGLEARPLVHLWAGWAIRDKRRWKPDTLVNTFSCTKAITLMTLLHTLEAPDRRCAPSFGWQSRVAEVWPAFGANGKHDVTLDQLTTHRAGLCFDAGPDGRPLQLSDFPKCDEDSTTETSRALSRLLANYTPVWDVSDGRETTTIGYHTFTVSSFVDQVVRRLDHRSRSTSRVWMEDIAKVHGIDFHMGIAGRDRDSVLPRVARIYSNRPSSSVQDMKQGDFGALMMDKTSIPRRAFAAIAKWSPWKARELIVPSALGFASAHGLARAWAHAYRSRHNDGGAAALTTPEAWAHASDPTSGPYTDVDAVLRRPHRLTPIGFAVETEPGHEGLIGHGGFGGSYGGLHAEGGWSIGYTCNFLGNDVTDDRRSCILRAAVDCGAKVGPTVQAAKSKL